MGTMGRLVVSMFSLLATLTDGPVLVCWTLVQCCSAAGCVEILSGGTISVDYGGVVFIFLGRIGAFSKGCDFLDVTAPHRHIQ